MPVEQSAYLLQQTPSVLVPEPHQQAAIIQLPQSIPSPVLVQEPQQLVTVSQQLHQTLTGSGRAVCTFTAADTVHTCE